MPAIMATLGTIAKIQKKPKCRRTGEWMKKMGHAYTRQYYPHKKDERMPLPATEKN